MMSAKIRFAIVALLSNAFVNVLGGIAEESTVPCKWTSADGGEFRYRFHAPADVEDGKRYPLVIFMHGAGERGTNNVAQLVWGCDEIVSWFKNRHEEFYLVAGQVPAGQQWVDTPWTLPEHEMPKDPSATMSQQIAFIEYLFRAFPIDRTRVYVSGISMGGYGTWDLLCRKPEWFAAGLPVCGGGDPHQAWRIREIPIWTFHGDQDGAVPVCRSRKMTAALWDVNGNIRYREYPGAGHNVWTPTYADKGVLDWFFSRCKSEKCP